MRAFPVRLPSGARYWTVLDEDLAVAPVANGFLRQVRFGRDGAESTTKSYAHSIALFLRWCARTGRAWQAGAGQSGLFMTWLAHAGPAVSGACAAAEGMVLAGPGSTPARGARRVNGVLTAVRGMVVHAVAAGQAGGDLVALLYGGRRRPGPARGRAQRGRTDRLADAGPAPAARAADVGGLGLGRADRAADGPGRRPAGRRPGSALVGRWWRCWGGLWPPCRPTSAAGEPGGERWRASF